VKQAPELRDQADLLMRQAEVAAAAWRDAVKTSTAEALRRLIQAKLSDGSLPLVDIRDAIVGFRATGRPVRPANSQS
jgi:hypothetical protein